MPKLEDQASYLRHNIPQIVALWEIRIRQEVDSAKHEDRSILRDEIPAFLAYMVDSLAGVMDGSIEREKRAKYQIQKIAEEHGSQRAGTGSYSLKEAIFEYRILRLVLFQILEEHRPLEPIEREIIVSSIEQAVQDMATQFAESIQESRELFVVTLVHDLRGPLSNATIGLHLLDKSNDLNVWQDAKNLLARSLKRLDRMTADLLDARKASAGGYLPLQYESFEVVQLLKEVIEDFHLGQRIVFDYSGSVAGYWSRDGLRRVFDNLIGNAAKFGTADTPIKISLKQEESAIAVSVHNEGAPIPVSEQASIFNAFFQSKSAPVKGWGIGLALVKGIVSAHRGTVKIISSAGEGTTFTVELPVK